MPEMSLRKASLGSIGDQARGDGLARIPGLRRQTGQIASVDKPVLVFAFDTAVRGSSVSGARLRMIGLPGHPLCCTCNTVGRIEARFALCPLCGSAALLPQGGHEMRIKNMEVV